MLSPDEKNQEHNWWAKYANPRAHESHRHNYMRWDAKSTDVQMIPHPHIYNLLCGCCEKNWIVFCCYWWGCGLSLIIVVGHFKKIDYFFVN